MPCRKKDFWNFKLNFANAIQKYDALFANLGSINPTVQMFCR
jgi:hypothetical protein